MCADVVVPLAVEVAARRRRVPVADAARIDVPARHRHREVVTLRQRVGQSELHSDEMAPASSRSSEAR